MTPDDRGAGATGSGSEERPSVASPDLESGKAVGKAAQEEVDTDREAGTRERVEAALRRGRERGAAESDSVRDGERRSQPHTPPGPPAGEHWSSTVRRRVAEGGSAPESRAPDPPDEEGDASGTSRSFRANEVRERVERRLQEAEDRRSRSADPPGPSPRPIPADPRRGITGAPRSDDLPTRPEDTPDWDDPWVEDEKAAAPAGDGLPAPRPSRLAAFIATCAFIGRVPVAPGTAGAVAGLVAFFLTRNLGGGLAVALLAVAVVVGLWAGARHAKDLHQPDPRSVVVDEFCGMWLALVGTNPSVLVIVAAFIAFRFLDIVKPPPVRQAERLPGGIGIMADDLVAGGIVRVVLLLALGM